MNSNAYDMRVFVPTTEVWLACMLSPDQYVQISFHKKPSAEDIRKLLAVMGICRPDAASQEGQSLTKPDSQESPAGDPANAAPFISNGD